MHVMLTSFNTVIIEECQRGTMGALLLWYEMMMEVHFKFPLDAVWICTNMLISREECTIPVKTEKP